MYKESCSESFAVQIVTLAAKVLRDKEGNGRTLEPLVDFAAANLSMVLESLDLETISNEIGSKKEYAATAAQAFTKWFFVPIVNSAMESAAIMVQHVAECDERAETLLLMPALDKKKVNKEDTYNVSKAAEESAHMKQKPNKCESWVVVASAWNTIFLISIPYD